MLRVSVYSFGTLLVFGFLSLAGAGIAPSGAIAKTAITGDGGQLRLDAGDVQMARHRFGHRPVFMSALVLSARASSYAPEDSGDGILAGSFMG